MAEPVGIRELGIGPTSIGHGVQKLSRRQLSRRQKIVSPSASLERRASLLLLVEKHGWGRQAFSKKDFALCPIMPYYALLCPIMPYALQ